jgi:hypothetical protein
MRNYFEPGVWLALIGLIGAAALIRWWLASATRMKRFQQLFCARYSIGFGLFLLALPLVAKWGMPSSLFGLFVLTDETTSPSIKQFVLVTAGSLVAALMVTSTYRVTTLNALARLNWTNAEKLSHGRLNPAPRTDGGRVPFAWCWFLLLGLWAPIWAAGFTTYECVLGNGVANEAPLFAPLSHVVIGITGGIALAALIIGLALLFQWCVIPDFVDCRVGLLPCEDRLKSLERPSKAITVRLWGALAHIVNSPGYTELAPDGTSLTFCPGHVQLLVVTFSLLLFYLGIYLLGAPTPNNILFTWSSSLWYLLIIVTIAGFLLGGLTFAVDAYRVPPTLVAAVAITLLHLRSWNAGHFFELQTARKQAANGGSVVSLRDALEDWKFPDAPNGKEGPTLVIVTAAGGGIQAAAWTAQVLTGLDEIFTNFSESVAVISSVSGGSVGTMYYVAERGNRSNDPQRPMRLSEAQRKHIADLASESSLEATAWGSAFPDLMRFAFPPGILDPMTDRGTTIERDWQWKLRKNGAFSDSLRDWGSETKKGLKPVVAFNSTLAATGEHLVMSSVLGEDPSDYQQFFSAYPKDMDLRIATAARLSATFSYVSPICQPFRKRWLWSPLGHQVEALDWRVADGGYFDNDGIVLATKWAEDILIDELTRPHKDSSQAHQQSDPRKQRFRNILILRIVAFPDTGDTNKQEGIGPVNNNLSWEVLGPIFCLNAARSGAQVERSNWETRLLSDGTNRRLFERRKSEAKPVIARLLTLAPEQKANLDRISTLIETPRIETQTLAESTDLVRKTVTEILGKQKQSEEPQRTGISSSHESSAVEDAREVEKLILRPILRKPSQSEFAMGQTADSIAVWSVIIRPPRNEGPDPPLSWKLTPSQKKAIRDAWTNIRHQITAPPLQPLPQDKRSISPDQLRHFFLGDPQSLAKP